MERGRPEKQRRVIQSIKRASDIMAQFIEEKRPLGITEFSRRLGLPKTTIASIVSTLEDIGYLEKDPLTGKYRLGLQIFQLGMKYATNTDLVNLSRAWMERLCFQFREPVNVGMMVGDKVTIVMRIEPENRYMVFPQAGSVIPAHSTCIGKVLFAFMEESKREAILSGYPFERFTESTISSPRDFRKELGRVRETGLSFDRQESINGLSGIGGPIFNHTGTVVAGFAVTGNPETIESRRQDIMEAVRLTTREVSSQLGYAG